MNESPPRSALVFARRLGLELRLARKACGLSQITLSERLAGVCSQQSLNAYERGVRNIPVARLIEVTGAMGVRPDELLARACRNYDEWVVYVSDIVRSPCHWMEPLRRWAAFRVNEPTRPRMVLLNAAARDAAAYLCGMTREQFHEHADCLMPTLKGT